MAIFSVRKFTNKNNLSLKEFKENKKEKGWSK